MKANLLPLSLLAMLLLALAGLGAWYAALDEDAQDELRQDLGIDDAGSGDIVGSGFLEAPAVTLSTAEGGRLRRLEVAEGDAVEAGQELLKLDSPDLVAELLRARAALQKAEEALAAARAEASLAELEAVAAAELRLARARQASLSLRLEAQSPRAPVTGTVLALLAGEGEVLPPGAALLRLGRLDPLRLVIYVAETDVDQVEEGQDVEITVDAYAEDAEDEDRRFEGEVLAVASEAEFTPRNVLTRDERASLVYAVTIEVPNPEGELAAGMPAEARIDTD